MAEMDDACIECIGVTRSYRGRAAVHNISLRIGNGICALLGPNGAGKSTLLKLMTGLEVAGFGTIRVLGMDLVTNPAAIKAQIGVLPDHLGLFESLTVMENLQCMGPIYGLSASETDERATSLLKLLELEQGRDTFASECSFGMRKKTALGMALLHRPRVLFLDEPLEGIDPSSSRIIERMLARLAECGTVVVLTSHLIHLVDRLATRVIVLEGGTVTWDSSVESQGGSLEEIYFRLIGEPQLEMPAWLG